MATAFRHIRKREGTVEVEGSGLRVLDVVEWCESGMTAEQFSEEFGVPLESVREALVYAEMHTNEIGAERKLNDDLYQALKRDRGLS